MAALAVPLARVEGRVKALERRYRYTDDLYGELCREGIEHPDRYPWSDPSHCEALLLRKAHELMVNGIRRRDARLRAENRYSSEREWTYERDLDDEFGEASQLLRRAINSLPATYRDAIQEALRASEAHGSATTANPPLNATQRTRLHRARRMLAEDSRLAGFFALQE